MHEIINTELPENWVMTTLGKVTQPIEKVKPTDDPNKAILYLDIGGIDKATNTVVDYKKYLGKDAPSRAQQAIKKGDVAFANVRPYLKNIAVVPNDLDGQVGSTGFCFLRPSEGVHNKYIYYWVLSNSFINDITKYQKGSRYPAVTNKQILERNIPLAPPEQQKRIVAKIEELFSHIDAGIEALKKAKQLLKQYRQSVLKAAVTGELTKEWREANKGKLEPASQLLDKIEDARNIWIEEQIEKGSNEAKRLKTRLKKHVFEELDASLIPEGWVSVSLTKLCLLVVDCHNKTAPYVDDGIPLIRTSNIRDGVINFEEKMKYVNQETYEFWSRRCPPEPGDILFTREAPMGESAIIPENRKVCMGQRMMLLRVVHDLVDINYLHIALMDPLFQKRVQGFKVGVGVQHLRVGDVEKAVIALPSLVEQKEIMRVANDRLDAMSRLENEIDQQLVKTEKNKQSVLAHAFKGFLD
ncbi:MAG: restriction endonuclease subunit S [Gammaproteobacteria bacterium]|nr:restriction endonuclease subunit S [Gammaproteobacteria bacterium]